VRGEQFGVAQPSGHPAGIGIDHYHSHAHRPGEGTTAHLIHPGDVPVSLGQHGPFQVARRRRWSHCGAGTSSKVSVGVVSQDIRSSGQVITNAVPTTLRTGTNPPPTEPRW